MLVAGRGFEPPEPSRCISGRAHFTLSRDLPANRSISRGVSNPLLLRPSDIRSGLPLLPLTARTVGARARVQSAFEGRTALSLFLSPDPSPELSPLIPNSQLKLLPAKRLTSCYCRRVITRQTNFQVTSLPLSLLYIYILYKKLWQIYLF